MMCCMDCARQFPTNYILLCVFTVFETCVCVAVAINYKTTSVAIIAGVTGALVLALSLYAVFTDTDFTGRRHRDFHEGGDLKGSTDF